MDTKIFGVLLIITWFTCIIYCTARNDFNSAVPLPQHTYFAPAPIYYPQGSYNSSHSSSNPASYFDQIISDKISRGVLEFSRKLSSKLENNSNVKSQIFSPISIVSALHLLLLGANGKTRDELIQLFNYDQDQLILSDFYKIHEEFGKLVDDLLNDGAHIIRSRPQPAWKFTTRYDHLTSPRRDQNNTSQDYHKLNVANGVFVQNGFSLRPDYKTAVESVYKSLVVPLDFRRNNGAAIDYINNWVKEETHGKIPTIISDQISADTTVIITSALYFKAFWEKEFIAGTTTADFYPNGYDNPPITVQMMANAGVFPYYDAKEYNCEIIGLPYKKDLSTMYIIRPYSSTRATLFDFQNNFTADKIEDIIAKMARKTAIIAIPKFHIQNSLNLRSVLSELGVNTIFTGGQSDLSLISNGFEYHDINFKLRDEPFIFSRFSELNSSDSLISDYTNNSQRKRRGVTYKVESTIRRDIEPLRLKDFVINKRITKLNPGKKRTRRDITDPILSIKNLDALRKSSLLTNPQIFVEEIVHKVDLMVNEKGTEGGAATVAYIRRSGPEVLFRVETPFLIIIRHDSTKLPLFYGAIYEPTGF